MMGADKTVNNRALLCMPETDATTFPVVAPDGTVTIMPVAFQLVTLASVPSKVTVLVPWVAPKLVPPMLTRDPTDPDDGNKFVIVRVGAVMVRLAEPQIDPVHAPITVEPVATAKARPRLVTSVVMDATGGLE